MPTWGDILKELGERAKAAGGQVPLDEVRRETVANVSQLTGRPTVLYASRWLQGGGPAGAQLIVLEDVHGFMEVLHGVSGPSLDLILHSPGGSPTAAEAIVQYLRSRFDDVRVFVPLAAMSAATMIACSADRIVMGKHSYMGPIDPQMVLETPLGQQLLPAYAIKQQFERAQADAANPMLFPAWIPMLQQYGPSLLIQCEHVIKLSEDLVSGWLAKWMFKDRDDAPSVAETAAKRLNAHDSHRVHDRYLPRDVLKGYGLVIDDLEVDQALQDAVLTVFHAVSHTFSIAGAAQKVIENHLGKTFIKQAQVAPMPFPAFIPGPPPAAPMPPAPVQPRGN
jgi:Serine dehydrogenase proteinase